VIDTIYAAAKHATEKYQTQIAENLAGFGAQIKLLPPEEYAQYLDSQKQLFTSALKTLDLKDSK